MKRTLLKNDAVRTLHMLRPVLFGTGLIFFVYIAYQNKHEILEVLASLHWAFFISSILVATIDSITYSVLFGRFLIKYGIHYDNRLVNRMFFFGQLAKYIPGRFWNVLYHASHIEKGERLSGVIFSNIDLMVFATFRTFVAAIAILIATHNMYIAAICILVGALVIAIVANRNWMDPLFYLVTRRNMPKSNTQNWGSLYHFLLLAMLALLSLLAFLAANYLLIASAFNLSTLETAYVISILGISWVIGSIAFVFPAGIGIREASFIIITTSIGPTQDLPLQIITAIAIVHRLWLLMLEPLNVFLGLLLGTPKKRYSRDNRG